MFYLFHSRKDLPSIEILMNLVEKDNIRKCFTTGYDSIYTDNIKHISKFEPIYQEACLLLETYFPQMGEILKVIKPRISYPLEGETFESASHPHTYGQIYYKKDPLLVFFMEQYLKHAF
jgi:hypothetical protein